MKYSLFIFGPPVYQISSKSMWKFLDMQQQEIIILIDTLIMQFILFAEK